MTEKPILMCAEMVRAVLAGQKSQTRRIVKPQIDPLIYPGTTACFYVNYRGKQWWWNHFHKACPCGQPGDRLWIKETWFPSPIGRTASNVKIPKALPNGWTVLYAASGDTVSKPLHWKPSIFMPRWASRLTLEIVSVRVERVQGISEGDALAEGVNGKPPLDDDIPDDWPGTLFSWRYKKLWDSLNAKSGFGWNKNPWVWVITFKKL